MTSGTIEQGSREKRMAALGSVGSAVVLVSLKVFLAALTGSLGILSEALHSILDLVAAVITYLSVRVADKPADAQHLYGHGKVESFSAFVETGLLLLTAVYIIWEAFQRLLFHAGQNLRPSLAAIVILALTMGIDFVRSRALGRVAKKYPSEALEADALHFSTDVWSTFVVVLGITGAWLGVKYNLPWLGIARRLRRARRGRRHHLDRFAARTADGRRAARRGAARLARANFERRGRNRRRAADRTRARAARGAALLRGCDHQRAAHREPRAGACGERRGRAQHREHRPRGRRRPRRAARAQ